MGNAALTADPVCNDGPGPVCALDNPCWPDASDCTDTPDCNELARFAEQVSGCTSCCSPKVRPLIICWYFVACAGTVHAVDNECKGGEQPHLGAAACGIDCSGCGEGGPLH